MGWYRWDGENLILSVRVQPRAGCDEIVGPYGEESLKVRISAPPVEGKANQHLIKFLAKAFGVAKGKVTLLKGDGAREKLLSITAPTRFPAVAQIKAREASSGR
ncbi:MAG: DUF167 family protein [Pseudomonadota bacterium]